MKGVWRADTDKVQVEERWTLAADDRLMGSSWLVHPAAPGGVIEAMTIQAGEHMTYRRAGERLTFVGDFIHPGPAGARGGDFHQGG